MRPGRQCTGRAGHLRIGFKNRGDLRALQQRDIAQMLVAHHSTDHHRIADRVRSRCLSYLLRLA